MKEELRGGKRKGAGRKPESKKGAKVRVVSYCDPETVPEINKEMKRAKVKTTGKLLDITFGKKK